MVTEKTSKSEATRERILETALALFAEAGFANTTMRHVAQLVRALGRHPRGRWFESNRAYQNINGLDQKRSNPFFF